MELLDFSIPHPSTISIIAPTGSGKSHLALEIIRRRKEVFSENIENVTFVYSEMQPSFYDLQATDPNVRFTDSLEDIEQIHGPHLVVVDDQQDTFSDKAKRDLITRFFIKLSHHRGISVILILQNAFVKALRDVNLNSQFLILFDFPRDRSTIKLIARQVCPGQTGFLSQAYNHAVANKEYGYLCMDFHPAHKKYKYWVRSNVFPSSDCVVYSE